MIVTYGLIRGWWYGLTRGWRRHCVWIGLMLLGISALLIATIVFSDPNGPSLSFFPIVAVVSVCLVWLGNKVRCRQSCESSQETTLDEVVSPVPSQRAIRSEDVLGPWRFYVDDAMSTVTIDLKSDGRYTEAIASNRGEQIACPGGDWKLDRAYLDLTSYRSAARAVSEGVRWFFGDWDKDFILFAKDDPQGEAMLQGRKVHGAEIFS